MARETISEYTGRIIGYIETEPNGDKRVTTYNGTVLGYYKKSQNVTTNYSGTILYRGDMSGALLVLK